MGYTSATVRLEDTMHDGQLRCMCGDFTKIAYTQKVGRVKDSLVTVLHVPVYVCESCGNKFMSGSDSIQFAKRVSEAVNLGEQTITF